MGSKISVQKALIKELQKFKEICEKELPENLLTIEKLTNELSLHQLNSRILANANEELKDDIIAYKKYSFFN